MAGQSIRGSEAGGRGFEVPHSPYSRDWSMREGNARLSLGHAISGVNPRNLHPSRSLTKR